MNENDRKQKKNANSANYRVALIRSKVSTGKFQRNTRSASFTIRYCYYFGCGPSLFGSVDDKYVWPMACPEFGGPGIVVSPTDMGEGLREEGGSALENFSN